MKVISTHTFKYTLRDIHKNTENRKFCFVIGAGASRKSGIPTGGELSVKWFSELKERLEPSELETWCKEQNINEKELASSYGSIYRKRFENDKTSGYEFLVQAMKSATPSFGHFVLGQILSRSPGHCILTTNFDSLIESSIYRFTDKTPLVCGHESLSGYARPSKTHPLIIKIHRDLLLSPKNDPDEINRLEPGWKEPLDHIFSNYIPVVIGYGGNDGSLMSYFEQMNKPSNFFWCGLDEKKIAPRTKQLIDNHDGCFVKITGFDELLYELLWVFDEVKPIDEVLKDITSERIKIVSKQFDEISLPKIDFFDTMLKPPAFKAQEKELSALEYGSFADKEADFEKRKDIYISAVNKYPSTGWLWLRFTHFLHFVKKDFLDLENYYVTALELIDDKSESFANILENYAIYLKNVIKNYDKAEEYYLKALSAKPDDADNNNNYAIFLKNVRKNYPKAEEFYLKALQIFPNHPNANGNYADFLYIVKKDYPNSKEYFLKALAADPQSANKCGNYACLLKDMKDYETADIYFQKALERDPASGFKNANYAQMLLELGEVKKAQKHLQIAFSLSKDPELFIELWFYRYAHYPEFLTEAENNINELLANGVRSVGWNFSGNIEQAIKDSHPEPEKLKRYAYLISTSPSNSD